MKRLIQGVLLIMVLCYAFPSSATDINIGLSEENSSQLERLLKNIEGKGELTLEGWLEENTVDVVDR